MRPRLQMLCAALLAQGLLGSLLAVADEPPPSPPIAERLHAATAAVKEKATEIGAAAKLRAREIGTSARRLSRTVADDTKTEAHALGNSTKHAITRAKAAVHKQQAGAETGTPREPGAR